jgi:hypothetical protein
MKLIPILTIIFVLSGCSMALDVLDIIVPDSPAPVCDKDSAGTEYNGKVCLKFSDGSYNWAEKK